MHWKVTQTKNGGRWRALYYANLTIEYSGKDKTNAGSEKNANIVKNKTSQSSQETTPKPTPPSGISRSEY